MHVFTSITANYLPKAAALAYSVKRVHPEAVFHVVLSDVMPECTPDLTAAFDHIIHISELPIPKLSSWIFKHRLVELCTAVKGTAFQYIAARYHAEVAQSQTESDESPGGIGRADRQVFQGPQGR